MDFKEGMKHMLNRLSFPLNQTKLDNSNQIMWDPMTMELLKTLKISNHKKSGLMRGQINLHIFKTKILMRQIGSRLMITTNLINQQLWFKIRHFLRRSTQALDFQRLRLQNRTLVSLLL